MPRPRPRPSARIDADPAAPAAMPAPSAASEWYVNDWLDFRICKPRGWHFVVNADYHEQMRKQEDNPSAGGDLLGYLHELSGDPLLVIAKYGAHEDFGPREAVCPAIHVYASPLERPDVLAEARETERAFRRLHHGYERTAAVRPMKVGGVPGAGFAYRYVMGEDAMLPVHVQARMAHGRAMHFSIGMSGPPDGPERADTEFAMAWASLRIGA
ncbi:MAG TPA: hypothetical protein VKA86_01925 [Candidatus Krumholzibacteria bacterium]|nr:hypothetical protein [Candidatus Krumholzibacteria bacterium]